MQQKYAPMYPIRFYGNRLQLEYFKAHCLGLIFSIFSGMFAPHFHNDIKLLKYVLFDFVEPIVEKKVQFVVDDSFW